MKFWNSIFKECKNDFLFRQVNETTILFRHRFGWMEIELCLSLRYFRFRQTFEIDYAWSIDVIFWHGTIIKNSHRVWNFKNRYLSIQTHFHKDIKTSQTNIHSKKFKWPWCHSIKTSLEKNYKNLLIIRITSNNLSRNNSI